MAIDPTNASMNIVQLTVAISVATAVPTITGVVDAEREKGRVDQNQAVRFKLLVLMFPSALCLAHQDCFRNGEKSGGRFSMKAFRPSWASAV
jgi:hypothetical protein